MPFPAVIMQNPSEEDEALLFYITDKILAFDRRRIVSSHFEYEFHNNGAPIGTYGNPSSLAGIMKNGVMTIYGMALEEEEKTVGPDGKPGPVGSKTYKVSQLSPVINPLGEGDVFKTTYHSAIAAVSATRPAQGGPVGSWVYFVKDAKKDKPVLQEAYDKKGNDKFEVNKFKQVNVSGITNLAAALDPISGARVVFFQQYDEDEGNTEQPPVVKYVYVEDNTDVNAQDIPDFSKTLRPGTDIDAVAGTVDGKARVYLYYINNVGQICCRWAEFPEATAEKPKSMHWKQPEIILKGNLIAEEGTNITVNAHGEHNHVYFVSKPKAGEKAKYVMIQHDLI